MKDLNDWFIYSNLSLVNDRSRTEIVAEEVIKGLSGWGREINFTCCRTLANLYYKENNTTILIPAQQNSSCNSRPWLYCVWSQFARASEFLLIKQQQIHRDWKAANVQLFVWQGHLFYSDMCVQYLLPSRIGAFTFDSFKGFVGTSGVGAFTSDTSKRFIWTTGDRSLDWSGISPTRIKPRWSRFFEKAVTFPL